MNAGSSTMPGGLAPERRGREERVEVEVLLAGLRASTSQQPWLARCRDEPETVGEQVLTEPLVHPICGDLAWQQDMLIHRKSSCHHICLDA